MIRTILKPENNVVLLNIPDELVGKNVEVTAFAIDEEVQTEAPKEKLKPSQMRGFLSKETADAMEQHIQKSREEWDAF